MARSRTRNEALLVADIGGTNARFGVWYEGALHGEQVYRCSAYPGPAEAAGAYLKQFRAASALPMRGAAAFAIAGPLLEDRVVMTNNSWDFSAAATRHALGLDRLIFLNDFTALALAVPQLAVSERFQVGGAAPLADGAIAVIGPGTGLGVSGLLRTGSHWLALQGEGGHAPLPGVDARETAVVSALHRSYTHVSAERVLSGDGLELLHRTLAALDGVAVAALSAGGITERALAGTDNGCVETVDLFCGWLGNVAGNLALTLGARGGVYIGGGIVPRFGGHLPPPPLPPPRQAERRHVRVPTTSPGSSLTPNAPAKIP